MANQNQDAAPSASFTGQNITNSELQATMMTSMAECFALQHSTLNIPYFDGKNVPLKNFLQDIQNGAVYVPPQSEGAYVKAILGKLTGTARDSTFGKTFNTVNDLIKHLKIRFAPGKNYPYYTHEIEHIRMKQGESVQDFYDRLNILINGAVVALEDKYGDGADKLAEPVRDIALEAFIRGLPDELARSVDARDPKSLDDAVKIAVRVESRQRAGILPTDTRSNSPLPNNRPYYKPNPYHGYGNSNTFPQNFTEHKHFTLTSSENRSRTPSPARSPERTKQPIDDSKFSSTYKSHFQLPVTPVAIASSS